MLVLTQKVQFIMEGKIQRSRGGNVRQLLISHPRSGSREGSAHLSQFIKPKTLPTFSMGLPT